MTVREALEKLPWTFDRYYKLSPNQIIYLAPKIEAALRDAYLQGWFDNESHITMTEQNGVTAGIEKLGEET